MPRAKSFWEQSADPTKLAIAEDILDRYNKNENNVQEIAKESPEFYRAIMYTLWPDAERVDGTSEYWQVVRYFEAIQINDGTLDMDWNDDVPQSSKAQAIAYANWRGHTRDLMESDEEYDMFIQSMEEIFHNINTLPVTQAFAYAAKDGWIWKHYKVVLEFILAN